MNMDMKEQLQMIKNSGVLEVSSVQDIDADKKVNTVKVEGNKINYNEKERNINEVNHKDINQVRQNEIQKKEYRRGEVYWCNLSGAIGSEQRSDENGRPCVIIQNDIGNTFSPTVIIAVLTSQLTKAKLPTHVEMMNSEYNLPKNSIALFEQVRTLDKRRIGEKICYLGDDMQKQLDNAVIISMTNPHVKSLLEKLPENMRNYIITTLKQIKRKEIQMKEMKSDGFEETDIKKVFDKKMNILKQFVIYCKNHQLDYEQFYVLNKGITDEINKSELIAL